MKYIVDSVHRDGTVELTEAWAADKHIPYLTVTCKPSNVSPDWIGKTVELKMVEDEPDEAKDQAP